MDHPVIEEVQPVEYSLFIGGPGVEAAGRGRIERRSPVTGQLVAIYPDGDARDVDRAVALASETLAGAWGGAAATDRSALLLRAADLFEASERKLAETLTLEVGKPIEQSIAEVREGVALWRYAAASLRTLHGEFYPHLGTTHQGFTVFEPVGVVGLIVPWNFPFVVTAERLPFMLAAGCTVVIKPSEFASGTLFQVAEILRAAGFPDGVCSVVSGRGPTAGEALVDARGVAMISFTGSTENGRRVMERAARTLKRVSLELGGKSPVVVFADASLEEAVEGVISGFTYNAGQCCIATSRLLLERSIEGQFKTMLLNRIAELRAQGGFSQPPATEPQAHRIAEHVALAKDACTMVAGSEGPPFIFEGASRDSRLTTDEIFGQVLSVYYFDTEEEAVGLANDTEYGLAACVWSGDLARATRVAGRIRAGRLWVNSSQQNFPELSIGGMGASGIGREAGTSGIRTYCEIKSVIVKMGREETR